ncbi:uncharacterized protein LOC128756230 isoform X2 [Synchiropus splendidus]|uniref:uncharacterized protein LOC128756230 isoform X2 n=1 Tax=Synchiropus splendidus TaxID=270530 RepID=UPI00237E2AFC|nr:uncharacterized protein LOC128756230 isoform X2 [Synchiropus splendidus]
MTTRAAYFSASETEMLMEAYEEVKDRIKQKGNTATVIKQREKAWQTIADRLNAFNTTGPTRTWLQVKIKYKNILQNVKKTTHKESSGDGSPKPDITPVEVNGRPVLVGIPGRTDAKSCPSQVAASFIQVSASTVSLLDPPTPAPEEADPGEDTIAAAADGDEDKETISLDCLRHEEPDVVHGESQPVNIDSQAINQLHANHLRRQIQLADVDIQYKKKKLEDLALESEIKRRTIRKLDLEIKKLEREESYDINALQADCKHK